MKEDRAVRVVLDANIFISAVLVPYGHAAQILQAWRAGKIEVAMSPPMVEEVRRVLRYPRLRRRHGLTDAEIDQLVQSLWAVAYVVPGNLVVQVVSEDPSDDIYIACAIESGATFLISGDQHLRRIGEYKGIRILSPQEFVTEVLSISS